MSREMKYSGITWIGEIPSHWAVVPFRSYVQERGEKNKGEKTRELLALSFALGVTLYRDKVFNMDRVKENYEDYQLVYKDDLVLSPNDIIKGSVYVSKYYGCISPMYHVFSTRDTNTYYLPYLSFLLRTQEAGRKFFFIARGLIGDILENGKYVTRRMTVSRQDLLSFSVLLPPILEQKKIVYFLDRKCSEIDEMISLQEKIIEELKAYKQSIITEAVCRGLNPDVPMKESGVEWIRQIPEGWNVAPFKSVYALEKGLSITKADLVEKGVPVISYGQIHSKINTGTSINDELIRFVPEDFIHTNPDALVKEGDIIFADTSEDLGGCGNCVYIDRRDTIFAGYHTIIAKNITGICNNYFSYLFLTDCWRKQIRSIVNGVKLFSIPQKTLSATSIIIPPIKEQQAIADYLDEKCAEIDTLISVKQSKIDALKEYKKSIIYEYITGKKEVEA